MIIEIDDDCLDTIIQSAIVSDYTSMMDSIKAHNKTGNYLHEDDFEAYQEVAAALKVLGEWYFPYGEFEKAVKAARKKK